MKFRLTNKPNRTLVKDTKWSLYIVRTPGDSYLVVSDSWQHAAYAVPMVALSVDMSQNTKFKIKKKIGSGTFGVTVTDFLSIHAASGTSIVASRSPLGGAWNLI